MGMNVYVELEDLVHAVPYLARLSIDKTESGEDYVEVIRNGYRATGFSFEGRVSFGRSYLQDIIDICLEVGIPFKYL